MYKLNDNDSYCRFALLNFCRYISDDGLKKLNENGSICDVKELTKRALDVSFAHHIKQTSEYPIETKPKEKRTKKNTFFLGECVYVYNGVLHSGNKNIMMIISILRHGKMQNNIHTHTYIQRYLFKKACRVYIDAL